MRFHRDHKSWTKYPYMFLDKGMAMKDGSPALLKSRSHLPKRDAIAIWKELKAEGWKNVQPQWGIDLEP